MAEVDTEEQMIMMPARLVIQMTEQIERLSFIESAARNYMFVMEDLGSYKKGRITPEFPMLNFRMRSNLMVVSADPLSAGLFIQAQAELKVALGI